MNQVWRVLRSTEIQKKAVEAPDGVSNKSLWSMVRTPDEEDRAEGRSVG